MKETLLLILAIQSGFASPIIVGSGDISYRPLSKTRNPSPPTHRESSIVPPERVIEDPIIEPKDSPGIAALPSVPNPAYTIRSVSSPKSITIASLVDQFNEVERLRPSLFSIQSIDKSNSTPLFSIKPIFVSVEVYPVDGSRGLLIIRSLVFLL